jgi:hypothetical protein
MFASKFAQPLSKAPADPTHKLVRQHSVFATRPFGGGTGEQAYPLQRAIGNQATLWLLQQRGLDEQEQRAITDATAVQPAPREISWDFSKLALFPPERENRLAPPSARGAQPGLLQPKLAIGPVDDPLEREADAVADRVMNAPADGLPVQRTCAACAHEEAEQLQQKATRDVGPGPMESVAGVLQSSGRPIGRGTREFFEPRFGYDFSRVRIHDDPAAGESAHALYAKAYTVGSHIVFGPANFVPGTPEGRALLAHELAHVVQQTGGVPLASGAWAAASHPVTGTLTRVSPMVARDASQGEKALESKQDEEPREDKYKGTLVSDVTISLARNRVGFRTGLGMILGDVTTDLKPGRYSLKPDISNYRWIVNGPGVRAGLRFSVDLEKADPWTLAYPESLPLTVVPGSAAEPKTFGDMLDPATGQLRDPLSLWEGAPLKEPISGIDDVEDARYDLSYRSEKGNASKFLIADYRDNTHRDIPFDSIGPSTPKLLAAKNDAIKVIETYNVLFMEGAFQAVFFILTMSPTAEPVAPVGGSPRYTVTRRQVARESGGSPGRPGRSLEGGEKEPLQLPRLSATTEENINTLIQDTNRDFPLTRVNAERVVRGPQGATAKVAGEGGAGADVTFTENTPNGQVVLRREVKCIQGGAQGSFNAEVGHAASDQLKYRGEIFVQVPAGTDATQMVLRFRGARTAEQLGLYRSVNITIADPAGTELFSGPLAP